MLKQVVYSVVGFTIIGILIISGLNFFASKNVSDKTTNITENIISPSPAVKLKSPTPQKILPGGIQVFQSFNNCGPASLSMALSHYDITVTQQEIGNELRPYQNSQGDNDDKSVTLEELAEKSKDFGFIPYHRPNGDIEKIKYFITYDMPVITRTWTKPDEDIGHYRVVKGYDENSGEIIQDDSLQNKNLRFSYNDFNILWEKFNFEYLVLVPQDKIEIVNAILGDEADEKIAWENALQQAQDKLSQNPNDVYARFNLSVALYNVGDFNGAIEEYEKVENQLPFRTLWYQIEPILAYQKVKNYDRVFEITNRIINNHNRAYSELYQIRGEIYLDQGNIESARKEFELAIFYNSNYKPVKDALSSL